MFSDGDPFADVDEWILKQEDKQTEPPTTQPAAPVPTGQRLPPTPRVPESRNATTDNVSRPSPPSNRDIAGYANESDPSHRTEGYYVAFNAVLPGVYASS